MFFTEASFRGNQLCLIEIATSQSSSKIRRALIYMRVQTISSSYIYRMSGASTVNRLQCTPSRDSRCTFNQKLAASESLAQDCPQHYLVGVSLNSPDYFFCILLYSVALFYHLSHSLLLYLPS